MYKLKATDGADISNGLIVGPMTIELRPWDAPFVIRNCVIEGDVKVVASPPQS